MGVGVPLDPRVRKLEQRVAELELRLASMETLLPNTPRLQIGGTCRSGRHIIRKASDLRWLRGKACFTCVRCDREAKRRHEIKKKSQGDGA